MRKSSPEQLRSLVLMLIILALASARSETVQQFFASSIQNINGALSNTVQGKTNQPTANSTLDWHLFLYWFVAAIIVVLLSDVLPTITTGILVLIIVEQLLVHWQTYAKLLQMPTK